MIIFDTETTGLLGNSMLPLAEQPDIIEFAALRLDDETLEERDAVSSFVRPRALPIPEKITKITSITSDLLTAAPSFARLLPRIVDLFLGQRTIVAHNCAFDIGMLTVELQRIGYTTKFPWPPTQTDTVALTMDLPGGSANTGRHKLAGLYLQCFGVEPAISHRAIDDARTLAEIVRWLRRHDARI